MKRRALASLVLAVAFSGVAWAFSFGSNVDKSTGTGPTAVACASLRGNGVLDLVVANDGTSTVSVLLGNGDGSFANKVDYTVGSNPNGLAIGSLRGNGILDIVACNAVGSSLSVMLGAGDGTFTVQGSPPALNSGPFAVALADTRNNGKLDAIVTCGTSNVIGVLLGNGDGTFAARTDYGVGGANPTGLAMGSLRGNGVLDIIFNAFTSAKVGVLLGNGDGTFGAAAYSSALGAAPYLLTLGDWNKDGHVDVAVAALTGGNVYTLLGNGDGTFQAPAIAFTPVGGAGFVGIASGDLNGDGRLDLVSANFLGSGTSVVQVSLGNGDGTFQAPNSLAASGNSGAWGCCVGDFDGDGKLEVCAVFNTPAKASVWLQTTNETRGGFPGTSDLVGNLSNVAGAYPRCVSGSRRSGNVVKR